MIDMQAEKNPRYWMWKRLGITGSVARMQYARSLGYETASDLQPSLEDYARAESFSIEPEPCAYNKKETAMGYNSISLTPIAVAATTNTDQTETEQRNYLRCRLSNIQSKKQWQLQNQYHLNDDPYPETPAELAKRFTEGRVKFPTDEEWKKLYRYNNLWEHIRFRDPKVDPDVEGFDKANDALYDSTIPVKDAINIQDPKDALKILQEFETTTLAN